MEENLKMIGVKREEEIELELGLSLGGGFTRSEKPVVVAKTEPGSDLREINRTGDQKREIEASRGQEAKWKRQDTQNKKQASSCYDNGGNGVAADSNNQVRLKSTELETKEQEQRVWKKSRIIEDKSGIPALPRSKMEVGNVNSSLTVEQNVGFNSALYPVIYPYPSVQYVQFATGFQYPCLNVVPYWTAGGGAGNYHQNVVQSMVNPSLRLFQSGQEPAQNIGHGCTSDQNSTKAGSNGSPVCSSSLLSEFGSSSREGGSSCDTGSHSSHCQPKQKKLNDSKANGTKVQSEYSASSHLGETECVFDGRTCGSCCKPTTPSNNGQCSHSTNCMTNIVEPTVSSDPIDCSQQTKPKVDSATEPEQIFNPVSTTDNQSKKDMCNPPKSQNQNKPELSQMPCVSTTGNGPNGKTVNGFLYRYTKGEVSIICVCHGISFTPAEFVQHAGGTEILHPLKHITVTPSAFRR